MPGESATIKNDKIERLGYSNVRPFSGEGTRLDNSRPIKPLPARGEEKKKEFVPFSGKGNVLGNGSEAK